MHSEQRRVHGQFVPVPTGTKVLRADAWEMLEGCATEGVKRCDRGMRVSEKPVCRKLGELSQLAPTFRRKPLGYSTPRHESYYCLLLLWFLGRSTWFS